MSLKSGSPRYDSSLGKYVLDATALQNSMALAMENQMKKVYKALKGTDLPDVGVDDRRMLFSAVAGGILAFLDDHADELVQSVTITHSTGTPADHSVSNLDLDIQQDSLPG